MVLPREAGMALRRGRVHAQPQVDPPDHAGVSRPARSIDLAAGGADAEAVRLVSQLLEALDYAHGHGVISGLLNLSRNLGLVTGASAMGAVFALGAQATDVMTARPEAIAAGMRATFAAATVLIAVALAIAIAGGRGAAGYGRLV